VIAAAFPQLAAFIATLSLSRLLPALGVAPSLYVLFATLTPAQFRRAPAGRVWPGALFTTAWWIIVAATLPVVLRLFFWLVGLGLVIGAEQNAALALEGQDMHPDTSGEETA
jgi:membrane protein